MAEGKWIGGLRPEMPLMEAAQIVLDTRLAVVADYLPRAVYEGQIDPENVHQFRVGTRRADAAVRIFQKCLPGRFYRKVREQLRQMRRAAGAARDADVLLIALRERGEDVPKTHLAGLDFLVAHTLARREQAQAGLSAMELEQAEDFTASVAELSGRLREVEGVVLGDLARTVLTKRFARLEQAATQDLSDYAVLHQVRIAGKRLRYAIEVLADCFAPVVREALYPQVEELQEILGRANDSHVALGNLDALRTTLGGWPNTWARVRSGIEGLIQFHQRRLPQERRAFEKWWKHWQQLRR